MDMERVQHHVADTGNNPALRLSLFHIKSTFGHGERDAVDAVGIHQINLTGAAVAAAHAAPHTIIIHSAHMSAAHMAAHTAVHAHPGHRLRAVFVGQHHHALHVEAHIHHQTELTYRQTGGVDQGRHGCQHIRQFAARSIESRTDRQHRQRSIKRCQGHPHLTNRQGDNIKHFSV